MGSDGCLWKEYDRKTVNVPIQPKQFWNVHVGGTVWLEGRRCSAGEGYGWRDWSPPTLCTPAWWETWQVYQTFGQMYLFHEKAKTGWKQISWDFKCLGLWTLSHKLRGPLKVFERGVTSSVCFSQCLWGRVKDWKDDNKYLILSEFWRSSSISFSI